MKIHVDGVTQDSLASDKKLKKFAKKDLSAAVKTSLYRMMNGCVSSFKDTDEFKRLVDVKFPILNYSM